MPIEIVSKGYQVQSFPLTTTIATELAIKVSEPLLIVLVHFKNALEDLHKGILRLRNDGIVEWNENHFDGLETTLEPYHRLKKLDPHYDIYIAPCSDLQVWYSLNVYREWIYKPDRVIIPVERSSFMLH